MTGPCFVDANVLVYARDPRDPGKQQRATAWLELLWRERLGRTSIQAISETYVALRRLGIEPEDGWTRVSRYFAWNPCPVDEAVLRRGRAIEQRHRISWWDSLIVAAAQLQECSILLTEDLQDGAAFGEVIARSPFTREAREPAAPSAAPARAASLHRPRGRPRRGALA